MFRSYLILVGCLIWSYSPLLMRRIIAFPLLNGRTICQAGILHIKTLLALYSYNLDNTVYQRSYLERRRRLLGTQQRWPSSSLMWTEEGRNRNTWQYQQDNTAEKHYERWR